MSRTTQCQACYSYGHNKRTCPALKEQAAIVAAAMVKGHYATLADLRRDPNGPTMLALGHPDRLGYYELRAYADVQEHAASNATRRKVVRKCSFCRQPGHNRRKCAVEVQHALDVAARTTQVHSTIAQSLRASGLVPGAVVSRKAYDNNTSQYIEQYGLVTGFVWKNLGKARDVDDADSEIKRPCWASLRNKTVRVAVNWSPVGGAEISNHSVDDGPTELGRFQLRAGDRSHTGKNYSVALCPGTNWAPSSTSYRGNDIYEKHPKADSMTVADWATFYKGEKQLVGQQFDVEPDYY